jgi:catechol 2,3-dioxygenase
MSNFHHKPNVYVNQVNLSVGDLQRSLKFYQDIIGFQILSQTPSRAELTANGKTALLSIEQPDMVMPKLPRTTGLYHYALLLPNRSELGKVLTHLLQVGYPLQGGSDHLVSEALYLADPDGNGIEIYVDRPASTWEWNNGEVLMTTEPMDAEGILAEGKGDSWTQLPPDTLMGHIHLHVAEFEKIKEFYCDGLGFEIVCRYGSQALFISTGGYHHHIGLNTWNGVGAPKPPVNSVGLIQYSIVFPSEEERSNARERLVQLGYQVESVEGDFKAEDPSGNSVRLVIE